MMNHQKIDKRTCLLETANELVHRQGFNRTTLAHIAQESGVPLGNVYYYYKTKDDIGHALIELRADHYRSQIDEWDKLPDPRKRILAFIAMVAGNRDKLAQSGCPIGSLCQELHKEGGALADEAAAMFTTLLAWLTEQFHLLGKGREAAGLALHLLSALQGASLLTHTYKDPQLILRETARLKQWIASLE